MGDNLIPLQDDDFDLGFLKEKPAAPNKPPLTPYRVLVVDDDPEIHQVTRLLLKNFKFEGRSIELLHGYSGEEAKSILKTEKDLALIFLDVVMEANDAGLQLVNYIRKELKNQNIRIVLRTGQPGEAPEERIIAEYDINDYRLKTELTAQRLYTSVYEALRSYRDLMAIEKSRLGLERMMKVSSQLFSLNTLEDFYCCVLDQILHFRNPDTSAICFREGPSGGVMFLDQKTFGTIIAATGRFSGLIGKNIQELEAIVPVVEKAKDMQGEQEDSLVQIASGYLLYRVGKQGFRSFIYVEGEEHDLDVDLIHQFLQNYGEALDNTLLIQQQMKIQEHMIRYLGRRAQGENKVLVENETDIVCGSWGEERVLSYVRNLGKDIFGDQLMEEVVAYFKSLNTR